MFKYARIICVNTVSQENYFFFLATALTHGNVLNELKKLDWETLCNTSLRVYVGVYHVRDDTFGGMFGGILQLPVSEGERIERIYFSEEERKSAGVLWWVDYHPLASWRLLITELYEEQKYSLANQIGQYAEKMTGMLSSVLYCHQLCNSSKYYTQINKHIMCTPISGREHEVNMYKVVPSMTCV